MFFIPHWFDSVSCSLMPHSHQLASAWKYILAGLHQLGAAPNFRACVGVHEALFISKIHVPRDSSLVLHLMTCRIFLSWHTNTHNFLKKSFWQTHVLFGGHWYPCFGFLVMYPLGFKTRVGSALFAFLRRRMYIYIYQDFGATRADLLAAGSAAGHFPTCKYTKYT